MSSLSAVLPHESVSVVGGCVSAVYSRSTASYLLLAGRQSAELRRALPGILSAVTAGMGRGLLVMLAQGTEKAPRAAAAVLSVLRFYPMVLMF